MNASGSPGLWFLLHLPRVEARQAEIDRIRPGGHRRAETVPVSRRGEQFIGGIGGACHGAINHGDFKNGRADFPVAAENRAGRQPQQPAWIVLQILCRDPVEIEGCETVVQREHRVGILTRCRHGSACLDMQAE